MYPPLDNQMSRRQTTISPSPLEIQQLIICWEFPLQESPLTKNTDRGCAKYCYIQEANSWISTQSAALIFPMDCSGKVS
jgi:hypothetical protein